MKKNILLAIVFVVSAGALFAESPTLQNTLDAVAKVMRSDDFIGQFPHEQDIAVGEVNVARPFMFDNGYDLVLVGFANYESTAKVLAKEGLIPVPVAVGGKKMAQVILATGEYTRTSIGPVTFARLLIATQINNPPQSPLGGYADVQTFWRYWRNVAEIPNPMAENYRLHEGWPEEKSKIEFNHLGVEKSATVKTLDGELVFKMKYHGENLGSERAWDKYGLFLAITPGNKEFNAHVAQRKIRLAHGQRLRQGPIPFDTTKDSFQAFGDLEQSLNAIEFKPAAWVIFPYYKGIYESGNYPAELPAMEP